MPVKTLYICEACGRAQMTPIPPNHFHPDVTLGVCGAPTQPVEYVRRTFADALEDDLSRLHDIIAGRGYDDPEPESLIKYREAIHP